MNIKGVLVVIELFLYNEKYYIKLLKKYIKKQEIKQEKIQCNVLWKEITKFFTKPLGGVVKKMMMRTVTVFVFRFVFYLFLKYF